MEQAAIEKAASSGYKKTTLLEQDPLRYWTRSILAGMYLTIVGFVYWSIKTTLHETPFGPIIASAFFGVGLSVIIFTHTELFTSNNMYLAVSSTSGRTNWWQTIKLWVACYLGNLIGALIVALLLWGAGTLDAIPLDHQVYAGAVAKTHQSAQAIFFKGILANWVVCLAVWMSLILKEEMARLSMVILVVFMFLFLGFEHSIANMGTFSISLLGHGTITLGDALFNLAFSTPGNIIGGALLVGLPNRFLSPVEKPKAD
ncbi:formate/nitrite transporter family protein [Niveibacterium terrae]|uniref:formate/nitrite transporter family protein n=1 Tax=Niveibacterium terrae TaxID=3373598 RepID=UPI003A901641